NSKNFESELPRGFNGLDGGASSGADVIHNHHIRALLLEAFNAPTHAVSYLGFSNHETVHRRSALPIDDQHCQNEEGSEPGETPKGAPSPALTKEQLERCGPG